MDSVTLAVLRAQNALLREYQHHLLATVYWSLGGLAVVVTVLLTFGWFANFRIYERDKIALKQELVGVIREENAKERNMITQNLAQAQGQLTERFGKLQEASLSAGKSAAETVGGKLERTTASLEHKIMELELKITIQEADEWHEKGVFRNELTAAMRIFKLAQTLGRDYWVSRTLDRIRETLRSGVDLDADLTTELVAALSALAPQHETEAESLKAAIRAART